MSESKVSSERELIEGIKELLKKNGHFNKLQAETRAKVTQALQERQLPQGSVPPTPTDEVLLVNELIREYLEWNGYLYTATVMTSEAALPQEKKSRSNLCLEVGVRDNERSSALPLLANIVSAYTERIKRKINKSKKEMVQQAKLNVNLTGT
ncbi:centrosomal protein 20-like [Plodia interpunctella]|uniref:centrosomal protein 20-like n=1 Tax=Plodia interpunctella TaxID=58824 RepID=UPI0023674B21|nr:centrosomal protein 20-like [Plodia interpunctella]